MPELDLSADRRFWGKASPVDAAGPDHHLLVLHCLDVAAVADRYLQASRRWLDWLGAELQVADRDGLRRWLVFWVALHDLGKFSLTFQAQCPELQQRLQGVFPGIRDNARHDTLGACWAEQVLLPVMLDEDWFPGADDLSLLPWLQAVTGHHGQPPKRESELPGTLSDHFRRLHHDAALSFARQMRTLLKPGVVWSDAQQPGRRLDLHKQLSWWVAGLTVMADWLGSNQIHFPYRDQPESLSDYWQAAQRRADAALAASGVLPAEQGAEQDFADLFTHIVNPSPLQLHLSQMALQHGPQLHILEDVTGAGKTEAALMLTHRLMAQGVAQGFYVGLPTMATAHALYDRIRPLYQRLFGESHPSLVLATGSAALVESFAQSVLPKPVSGVGQPLREADSAEARCAHWVADHSKRALLAPAGIGTIDQALLAVLKGKHQSLRLLGLAGKVLVVDEVHACDAYMERVLATLLTFHARAGGSALLLSATLTERMKQTLLSAFASGCQQQAPTWQPRSEYPLATHWAASQPGEVQQTAIATRPDVRRQLQVQTLHHRDAVRAELLAALQAGRSAAWLCNTVADALELQALMAAYWPAERITLFHARFALADRLDIETKVLATFGATSGPAQRAGQLLIATQVAEQSLDIDVDLLASDLAPIDRLIQRAGRLHRHRRMADGRRQPDAQADERGIARLIVHAPAWTASPAPGWLRDTLPRTGRVYDNHAVLWRTAEALQAGQLTMPDEARALIERVFTQADTAPAGLQRSENTSIGKSQAEASEALRNTLKLPAGYDRDGLDWADDSTAPTRLGEPSKELLLARWDGVNLLPWAERPSHAWAYSTVKVATRLVAAAEPPANPALRAACEALLGTLSGGEFATLLPLERGSDGTYGASARNARGQLLHWQYSRTEGLQPFRNITPREEPAP